jgi:predicted Zn-dependent peptidase
MTPMITLFNEYFGGGMSSVVFQTIRESKALAYSTYSRYLQPSKKNDPYYIMAYVGTQSDKMNEAVPAMNELLNDMPQAENMFEAAKGSLINGIETQRTNDADIIFSYVANEKLGLTKDINKDVYESLPKITLKDVVNFQQTTYKNKPFTYCIMGSKDKIKMDDLSKYGKVTEVSLEEIFGY